MKLKIIVRRDGKIERYLNGVAYEPLLFLECIFPGARAKLAENKNKEDDWDVYFLAVGVHSSPTVVVPSKTTLTTFPAKEIFNETIETIRLLQKWLDSLIESEYEGKISLEE